MSVFTLRHQGYKAGVFLLFLGFLVFLIGYASPYWISAHGPGGSINEGTWMLCQTSSGRSYSLTRCTTIGFQSEINLPAYFNATRALAGFGLLGLLVSFIYALATNCCRSVPNVNRTRMLEIFTGISAVLCLLACIVYGAMRIPSIDKDALSQSVVYYDWAFYLAVIGSILALLAAILIGVFNKELQTAPQGMVMAPVAAAPPYAVTQNSYAGQGQPQQYYPPQEAGY